MDYNIISSSDIPKLLWTTPLADEHLLQAGLSTSPLKYVHYVIGGLQKIPIASLVLTIIELAIIHLAKGISSAVDYVSPFFNPPLESKPPSEKKPLEPYSKVPGWKRTRTAEHVIAYGESQKVAEEMDYNKIGTKKTVSGFFGNSEELFKIPPGIVNETNQVTMIDSPASTGGIAGYIPRFTALGIPAALDSDMDGPRREISCNGKKLDTLKYDFTTGRMNLRGFDNGTQIKNNDKYVYNIPIDKRADIITDFQNLTDNVPDPTRDNANNSKTVTKFVGDAGNRLSPKEINLNPMSATGLLVDLTPPSNEVIVTLSSSISPTTPNFVSLQGKRYLQTLEFLLESGKQFVEEQVEGTVKYPDGVRIREKKPQIVTHNEIEHIIWTPFGMGEELKKQAYKNDLEIKYRLAETFMNTDGMRIIDGIERKNFMDFMKEVHNGNKTEKDYSNFGKRYGGSFVKNIFEKLIEDMQFDPTELIKMRKSLAVEFAHSLKLFLDNLKVKNLKKFKEINIHIVLPARTQDEMEIREAMLDALAPGGATRELSPMYNVDNISQKIAIYTSDETAATFAKPLIDPIKLAQDLADEKGTLKVAYAQETPEAPAAAASTMGGEYRNILLLSNLTNAVTFSEKLMRICDEWKKLGKPGLSKARSPSSVNIDYYRPPPAPV